MTDAARSFPRGILWDLDGTLLDTASDIAWALNATLAERALAPLSVAVVRGLIGQGARVLLERALKIQNATLTEEEVTAALLRFEHHYWQLERSGESTAVLYPGVRDVLTALSDVPMAIVTNKPERIARETVRHCGLEPFFRTLIGADSLPERKPHPLPLLEVCRRLHVEPSSCVMVGDSITDWAAARAVPMRVILVAGGYSGDVTLSDLAGATVLPSLNLWSTLWD